MVNKYRPAKPLKAQFDTLELGDLVRDFLKSGGKLEQACALLKRKPATLELYIELSEIFPPHCRSPHINLEGYKKLSEASDPASAAKFVHREAERGFPLSSVLMSVLAQFWQSPKKDFHPMVQVLRFYNHSDEYIADYFGLSVKKVAKIPRPELHRAA